MHVLINCVNPTETVHGTLRFLYLSHLLYGIWVKIFIMNRYISKSYTTSKNTIRTDNIYTVRGQLWCQLLLVIIIITIISKHFCILGSVLDWGTCFWILGSVICILESVLDSGMCFWILGSVWVSGKCAPAFCWLLTLRSLFSRRLASPQNLSLLNRVS